jgi:hypothetical protein
MNTYADKELHNVGRILATSITKRERNTRLRGLRVRIEADILLRGAPFSEGSDVIETIDKLIGGINASV